MSWEIAFNGTEEQVFESLQAAERRQIEKKLTSIANDEFRHPREWDFCRIPTSSAEGRFRVGNGLRVFADIDERRRCIKVHSAARRENLYS